MMTNEKPSARKLTWMAIGLNVFAGIAITYTSGLWNFGTLRALAWWSSSNVTSGGESDGNVPSNSATASVYDVFPPEVVHSPMPEDEYGDPYLSAFPPTGPDGQRLPVEEAVAISRMLRAKNASVRNTSAAAARLDPLDWTFWRGPRYDGSSPETGLVDSFNPRGGEGSNVAWKREDLGTRSTPVVMNGKLYLLARAERGTEREGEKVVCLDAETGKTVWENRFNVWLSDVPDTRVGWSSVVADPATGRIYAQGVCGLFLCLDGETGKRIWSVPLHEFFGLLSTYGGRTNFPVICDDLVITSGIVIGWGDKAKPAHRLIAFDKATGQVVWFRGTRPLPYDTTYSAPSLCVLDGQKALVFGSGDGSVWAWQPRTGLPLWHCALSRRGLNVAPLVVGNTVYIGHSEENDIGTAMGTIAAIDGTMSGDITKSGEQWRVFEFMAGKSAPVRIGQRLYCVDDRAKLHVLDRLNGEELVPKKALGTAMRSSLLYADGKLYVTTQNGRWYILRPDEEKGVEVVSKGRFPSGEGCDASPICSHGRIYIATSGGLYCLRDPEKESLPPTLVEPPSETPIGDHTTVAHVQIIPAEVLLEPGQTQPFRVRLFNDRGQFLKESTADFSAAGPGQMQGDTLHIRSDAGHAAVIVTAKVGKLENRARVRVVPPLPWEFTFEGLSDPPISWVGARVRHVIREVEGNNVMVKITTIPKGTRSRCWFGPPDLSNYTIQADVRGAIQNEKMPDIGLIAQGYAIDLQGAGQKIQIRSWVPQLRMAQTVEFPWKPNVWYVMKMQASVEGGKARLRGKVWPRGEAEPQGWTIEAVDTVPNVSGSPGLFGNAKDAEILIDNVKVFSNP